MNETEKLRALLDERGVKWWPMRNGEYYEDRDTEFVIGGKKHTAHQWGDGFAVYGLTAEQVVDATLGREVTPMLVSDDLGHVFITLGGIKTWDVTEDAAKLTSERETGLIEVVNDVLRHASDTVWVNDAETLVDRMVALGIYGHDVYGGARPWEVEAP